MAFYRAQRSAATLRDHNDDVNVVDDDGDFNDDDDGDDGEANDDDEVEDRPALVVDD